MVVIWECINVMMGIILTVMDAHLRARLKKDLNAREKVTVETFAETL